MAKMFKQGLYIFQNDLRLEDNAALQKALDSCEHLAFLAIFDERLFQASLFTFNLLGEHRFRFLCESLLDLASQLALRDHTITVLRGNRTRLLKKILSVNSIDMVFYTSPVDTLDIEFWSSFLEVNASNEQSHTRFMPSHQNFLFDVNQLPFALGELPKSFSQFRRQLENKVIHPPVETRFHSKPLQLEYADQCVEEALLDLTHQPTDVFPGGAKQSFVGGCQAGTDHLQAYLAGGYPSTYKTTRNALDGWSNSTKFSPWLNTGCLSVRAVWHEVLEYERQVERNKSTAWILFELLWREYFQWYARKLGAKLFNFSGLKAHAPLQTFYAQRFRLWQSGSTPFPIVNACMNQLNATGYMSNRGRQLVASCFVHELGLDWRFGAAYFQRQLLDYDTGSNWGNWQYLAGVGADPRGWRQFNLEKQTNVYDPQGEFIEKWGGRERLFTLDAVDIVDWPLV